ncbi:MAG: hypothetical protein R2733_25965 [Acidimicrobiales bacterium]
MGMFDKAKELADQAEKAVEEHGDKLPGGLGDKAKYALDKVDSITDKIPGQKD